MAFLKNLAKMLGPKTEPAAFLAAFGKHPGWNDHLDDIGLDTDDLITAKRILYLHGINQNIDGGAWENLDPPQRLDSFQHDLLWYMPPGMGSNATTLITGRLWASVDGKGRDKYPMVLCAQTNNLPDTFAARVTLPLLQQAQERCVATRDAGAVRNILESDLAALRSNLGTPLPASTLTAAQVIQVANSPDLAPSREGFHRILYHFTRALAAYRPGASASLTRRPEQLRVPLCGMSPNDALIFWFRFAFTLLDPAYSLLLLSPAPAITRNDYNPTSTGWIDILVGEPAPQNLFCLKASPKSLPLTSDIPYTLDPSFRAAIDRHLHTLATLPPNTPLPAWPNL